MSSRHLISVIRAPGLLGYFLIRDRSRIAETRRVFSEHNPAERLFVPENVGDA